MNERADILLEMLGQRLKQTRLNADRTQQEVADIIGMSRTAIEGAEKGKCNLSTFVSILLALDATDQLDLFLPEPPPSPVLLAKATRVWWFLSTCTGTLHFILLKYVKIIYIVAKLYQF